MTLEEKLRLFKDKGWTYNQITGDIYSHTGRKIIGLNKQGYLQCKIRIGSKLIIVKGHQLGWFLLYNESIKGLDHIDRDKSNNSILNLRNISHQENRFNNKCNGYSYHKRDKCYYSHIVVNSKQIYLGSFNSKTEARNAYLEAKKIYHQIGT